MKIRILTSRNMQYFALFIILLSFFAPTLSAQNVKVDLSEQYEEPKNSVVFDVVGYDDGGFVFGRYTRKGFFNINVSLEKYNKSLKFLNTRNYEYEADGEEIAYGSPFYFHGKIYLLGSTYVKKTKKRTVYYHEVDAKTLSAKGNPQLLKSIQEDDNGSVVLADYTLSRDQNLLAFYGLPGYIKKSMSLGGIPIQFSSNKDEVRGSIMIMREGMEKIWARDFTFPYEEELYSIKGSEVDNKGNFYILGRLFNEKVKEKSRGLPNYKFIITAFRNNGEDETEYSISLDNKFITDCNFTLSADDKIICTGFYSDKGTASIKGTFFMTIDPESKEIISKGLKDFDTEFLKLFMSDKKAEKGSELANFDLDEIILREDGGAILIGEKNYIVVSSSYNPSTGKTTTTTTYHFNDIIIININPDHSIQWATKIPKKQASSSGFYLSYASHIKDDMIYLIFNDNEKNLDEKNPEKIYSYDGKNSYATLVTVEPDGKWEKSALFSNKEEGVIMRPLVSEQINENELIIYAERGRKYVVGKITFE